MGRDEVEELEDEVWHRDNNADEEAADCLLILMHYFYRRGVSALDEARKKFEICKGRTWGNPDERGVVRHVEAGK